MKTFLVLILLSITSYANASIECRGSDEDSIYVLNSVPSGFYMKTTFFKSNEEVIRYTTLNVKGEVVVGKNKETFSGKARTTTDPDAEALQTFDFDLYENGKAVLILKGQENKVLSKLDFTCLSIRD